MPRFMEGDKLLWEWNPHYEPYRVRYLKPAGIPERHIVEIEEIEGDNPVRTQTVARTGELSFGEWSRPVQNPFDLDEVL